MSRTKERQTNQTSRLDGLHRSTNGGTAPIVSFYAPTPELELLKGVLSHAATAERVNDHVVAVVDVRRACFNAAEPLPKTIVELPDYFDIDTRTRCCGIPRRCMYRTRQAARSWQREVEKGIKAAGKDVEVFFQVYMREIGGGRARRRHCARWTEITC